MGAVHVTESLRQRREGEDDGGHERDHRGGASLRNRPPVTDRGARAQKVTRDTPVAPRKLFVASKTNTCPSRLIPANDARAPGG